MIRTESLMGSVTVVVALSVCLTTFLSIPGHPRDAAMMMTPLYAFTVGGIMIVASLLARINGWAAAFVAYMALRALVAPPSQALSVVVWITVGVLIAAVVASPITSNRQAAWARRALLAMLVLQVVYGLVQLARVDPLWIGWGRTRIVQVHGTFENARQLGGFAALLAPLAPPWLLPLCLAGVVISQSFLALTALLLGLLVRYCRPRRGLGLPVRTTVLLAGAASAAFWLIVTLRGTSVDSLAMRLTVWRLAINRLDTSWGALLFGRGPGGWFVDIPDLQVAAIAGSAPDAFFLGHNDPAQLFYDGGAVALALLLGLAWSYRDRWRDPIAGGVVTAATVYACGMSPFHLPTSAALNCLAIGLVLRRPRGGRSHGQALDRRRHAEQERAASQPRRAGRSEDPGREAGGRGALHQPDHSQGGPARHHAEPPAPQVERRDVGRAPSRGTPDARPIGMLAPGVATDSVSTLGRR